MFRKVLVTGFVVAVLCLALPILWPIPLIIGIVALFKGAVKAGAALIVTSLVLTLIGGIIVQALFVKPFRAPSESMAPTIALGDHFLVWRHGDPGVGDIVVFHPPGGATAQICGTTGRPYDADHEQRSCARPTKSRASISFVKRIVAGPGNTVAVRAGHVVLDGRPQKESFIKPCGGGPGCDLPRPITVPPDHYFMMGDNRGASDDSRFWGPVPRDWIVGRAVAVYWPLKHVGGL